MSVLLEKCTLIPFIWDRILRRPLLEDLLNSAKEFMLKLVKTTWRCFQASVLNQILILKNFSDFFQIKTFKASSFYHDAIRNSLSDASWGVNDIEIKFSSGVEPSSITRFFII